MALQLQRCTANSQLQYTLYCKTRPWLDVRIRQAARRLDHDILLLARALVLCTDVDDPVRIDVKGDLDLRGATRGGGDANEIEVAQQLVVRGIRDLT